MIHASWSIFASESYLIVNIVNIVNMITMITMTTNLQLYITVIEYKFCPCGVCWEPAKWLSSQHISSC